jgi:hydroxyethylthiazole kinase-like uncharacterized protein yjeF
MIVVSAEEMRRLDRLAIEKYGVPSLALMERAGRGVAEAILRRFGRAAKKGVVVVAGKGNNGGDGFVAARVLKEKGIACEVVLVGSREEVSPDAAANLEKYEKRRGQLREVKGDPGAQLGDSLRRAGLVVDALLGTGLKKNVEGAYAEAIDRINASGLPVVAVDLPSGLDADTGQPLGRAVRAALTVTFGFAKIGQVIHPGIEHTGELEVVDIGIDARAVEEVAPRCRLMEEREVAALAPRREPDSHKGTYGHLLIVAGSRGKTGAGALAARGALRVGTGLVTLAAPRSLNDIYAVSLTEAMTELLPEDADGEMAPLDDGTWARLLERKSALLVGPGIGVRDSCRAALRWLIKNLALPWVIDADGLNNLAADVSWLARAKTPPVLTPHPGEMARLVGSSPEEVNRDRVGNARRFAETHGCYLVLKGARTVIAAPDGRAWINPTGNPGMATGGMGDVLAGMLAGLLAQRLSLPEALMLGVFLHGLAADRVKAARGEIGMIASDVVEELPAALRDLAASKTAPDAGRRRKSAEGKE